MFASAISYYTATMAYNVSNQASFLSLLLVFFSIFFGGFIVNLSEAHKDPAMYVKEL